MDKRVPWTREEIDDANEMAGKLKCMIEKHWFPDESLATPEDYLLEDVLDLISWIRCVEVKDVL